MSPKLRKILGIAVSVVVILLIVGVFTGRVGIESDGTLDFHPQSSVTDNGGLNLIENNDPDADPPSSDNNVISDPQTTDPVDEPNPQTSDPVDEPDPQSSDPVPDIDRDGEYTTKEDVALYIHTYGCLPGNFVTKKQAQSAGWSGGGLDKYFYGCSIGGDIFGNREGLLPKAKSRVYYECDINTMNAKSRGAERIVFSNDGLVYYTGDHYESFTLLYGEE